MSHREQDDPSTHDTDATLDRAWREASAEAPPPGVDARILAAAREAVARRDRDSRRERTAGPLSHARWTWRPLLAAAAVAGIAFAILPPLLQQAERPAQRREDRSANVPAAVHAVQPERDAGVPSPSQLEPNAVQAPSSSAPASSAAARSAESAGSVVSRDAALHDQAPSVAGPVPTPPAATEELETADEAAAVTGRNGALARTDRALPSAPVGLSTPAALPTPAERAAKVAALYESGDVTAAAAELRAFRAVRADADTYLPSALQAWARTVE